MSSIAAGLAVTVPVSVYLLSLWFLHDRPEYGRTRAVGPIAAAIILLTTLTGQAVFLTGLTMAVMIGGKMVYLKNG